MDAILTHIQDNMAAYIVAAAVILPILIAFRKYTGPVIFRIIEGCTYFAGVHLLIGGFTRFAWYFKSSSQMQNNIAQEAVKPFTTPFSFEFYQKELYNPQWVFWLEVASIFGILYIITVLRPVSISQKNTYKGKANQARGRGKGKAGRGRATRARAGAASRGRPQPRRR